MTTNHRTSLRLTAMTLPGALSFAAFSATGPASNWLIQHFGTICIPDGPCLIPVFPDTSAPSGVLMIGLALVLRDIVHRELGPCWTVLAIAVGALLSAVFSPPALLLASTLASVLSELADFAVFAPLQRRGFFVAAFVSSSVGLIVDSVLFLVLAFGSLEYLTGQVLGKLWMVLAMLIIMAIVRRWIPRLISP